MSAANEVRKRCIKCREKKSLIEFHVQAKSNDGRQGRCKVCACRLARDWGRKNRTRILANKKKYYRKNKRAIRQKSIEWVTAHPERALAFGKKYRDKNPEKERARARKYRLAHTEEARQYAKRYHAERPELKNIWDAKRRAQEIQAMPKWADKAAIKAFYAAAKERQAETGIVFHVDHIVPLTHKLVCGLHVPCNLQIIPGIENTRKNNRFYPQ